MKSYQELYFYLFGQMADALELLEKGQVSGAKDCLLNAQLYAEECAIQFDTRGEKEGGEQKCAKIPRRSRVDLVITCTFQGQVGCLQRALPLPASSRRQQPGGLRTTR